MQRQSLGSPSTKNLNLHQLGSGIHPKDDTQVFLHSSSLSSSFSSPINNNGGDAEEDDELKKSKIKTRTIAESYIHLIPILTFLCFLILYLSSHAPSHNDLTQFNRFKSMHVPADSEETEIAELHGTVAVGKGGLSAELRSLKQRRLHRKIAGF